MLRNPEGSSKEWKEMTKKKSKKEESAQKISIKKEEIAKAQVKKEDIEKGLGEREGLIQRIIGKPVAKKEEKIHAKVEEKLEQEIAREEGIIEKGFVNKEEAEKAPIKKEEVKKGEGKKEGLIQRIIGKLPVKEEKVVEQKVIIEEVAKAPAKKEEGAKTEALLDKILGKKDEILEKIPIKIEEKAEQKVTKEEKVEEKVAKEGEAGKASEKAVELKAMVEEKLVPEPLRQISEADLGKKCSEMDRLQKDFKSSVDANWEDVGKVRNSAYSGSTIGLEKNEKELYAKFESSRNEVRAELDELHKILGKYEERVRYKDEAEGELQTLEEVKLMLGEKLKNISRRIERLKVRSRSDLVKLSAEANECEEEVRRSEVDILDFEKEYTKFLSMMGKISG
jgi:hypothetical protein